MIRDYHEFLKEVMIPEEKLQQRIKELGAEISRDYNGQPVLLVCILRGGVMFLTDLIRQITTPVAIEFMAVSSYGRGARESTGNVRITLDLISDISNCNVLIVEDIIDSGRTLASVIEILNARRPKSLEVCTLLDKASRREVQVPLRYRGFVIPNEFVFVYGLDIDEYYRNLTFIGSVDLDKYQAK
ncbi:MAG TPA: hypoxanthine phosphoribosyltransferase [Anaerolineaceae bacterium]